MKIYLLALCLVVALLSNGQNNITRPDSANKKNGSRIIYLDKSWKEVTDSNTASFCRYAYFENGINIQPMDPCGKGWYFINSGGSTVLKGSAKILDGVYTWSDINGNSRCIASFRNGECVYVKWLNPSGSMKTYYDYTKKWKGQDHSYFITSYDQNGIATYSYWRKDQGSWGSLATTKDGM